MSFIRGYDQENLRELVDLSECAVRLEEIEGQRSLPALLERVWLLKVLDRLDEALTLADEAVRRLTTTGDYAVMVTDVDMPGSMNGIQLAHYVRDRWPGIQILVISGKVGVAPSQLPPGALFMSKPYQEPRLIRTIETLAAQGSSA